MEFDAQSQCSDEGAELSLPEHGTNYPGEFMFVEDVQPEFLEAKLVYLLLPKNVPVSRAARLQWLLDHLNTTVTASNPRMFENSQNLEIISAIPREQNNIKCSRFLITYRTELKFVAHAYRFVYCLDMSPSHANVNIKEQEVLFDQILHCFKCSIEGLSKKFTIPGNTLVFKPCIYLTIMANTPFFISPAQQVILKGVQMTPQNLGEIIKCLETHFHTLEGKIADVCAMALDQIDLQRASCEGMVGDLFDLPDSGKHSKIPMVTPDANFVNMLRYSLLAISLLPETTLSHILVITDGIVAMPDSNVMETLLFQLHYDAIAVSFLKVGSSFHPHVGAGLVSYTDLLHFLAHSTLGTCLESFSKVVHDPSMSMNQYQEIFLLWSFHTNNRPASTKNCDNSSWTSTNDTFYNQRLPTLLSKRQTEESIGASILLLLARRMREGFTVDNVFFMNGNLEIRLINQWKSSIYIHYKVCSQWPIVKNLTHFEVHVCAPYEFLHDMTCLIKKETKSVYRQAIIQRFWSRLSQLSSGDLSLAVQLSAFPYSKDWYTLPESVKSGIPVFISNNPTFSDSTKLVLTPRDISCPKFVNIWQGICQMETYNWRKWFHTHKISLILTHDTPLPKHLHIASSSQRYQVVQCRQAVTALYGMLADWASFVLLDNHTYLKLLYNESDKPPLWFCIVRVSSKFPSAVLNVGFFTNTPGYTRHEVCDQLKSELSSLSYLLSTHKTKGPPCCVLLQKPLEKILIKYERIPNNYTTVIFPDGTQPPQNASSLPSPVTGSLFTTLSRYLFHKRWIWSATHYSRPKLPDISLSRILNTLTRMRLKEGFHFAHSSSGIVTMVLEIWLEPLASCVVQYVLFPPHYNWGDDSYSGSEEENEPLSEMDAEMQMVTEVWIEPQYGKVVPDNALISYINNLNYYQIADAISRVDFRCINVLLTMEHMNMMCRDKGVHNLSSGMDLNYIKSSFSKRGTSRKNSRAHFLENQEVPENGSQWYPIVTPRIEHIPFEFDPIGILPMCQQTELLFSMLREEKSNLNKANSGKEINANKLLLDNIFEHFLLLHDQELQLCKEESDKFTQIILSRHKNKFPHTCPISEKSGGNSQLNYNWRCFIRGVSVTHVILTFVAASVEDLKSLTGAELNSNIPADLNDADERTSSRGSNFSDVPFNTPNSICLPIYVYDCPLKLLVNAYVKSDERSSTPEDVYEDHRFKFASFLQEDFIKLKGDGYDNSSDEYESPDSKNIREHCRALVLTHSKCFTLSLFLALHKGIYVHNSDVQSTMDLCEEEITEIDVTEYIKNICAHVKQNKNDHITTQVLHEAFPCSESKSLHMLIKNKFFKMICSSFNRIPSNGEYYYYKHLCIRPDDTLNDSDDELSASASDIEFRSERDLSIYSEGPHLLEGVEDGLTDIAKMSDVSPLFLHLICTLRYNNGGNTNTSVRVLPTCLGELIQTLDTSTEYLIQSKLQITLDILCLTLPSDVQNIITDYSQQGLRTTSFCSDGFQRSVSSVSNNSMNSDFPEQLGHLTDVQKKSVDDLCKEIKWLLKDEICTSLLDSDSVNSDTLNFVIQHVTNGHSSRISCRMDQINLNFVYKTNQSHEKFLEEFATLPLPLGYNLCKEADFYYLSKDHSVKEKDTHVNNSFAIHPGSNISNSIVDFPLNIHELFNSSDSQLNNGSCKEDTVSQQSDISSGSMTGTDGGYDEDVSEDEEDFNWLLNLNNKRAHLPNFWLILKVDQDIVTVYFHCRFLELPTMHVESYLDVERSVCDSIADLCKKVNQLLLLQSLYETKSCDSLLEADDSFHNDVPVSRNQSYNRLKQFDADTSDDSDIMMRLQSMSEASLNLKPGYFSCSVVWEKLFVLHPRLKTGPGGKSGISRGIWALKSILDKFSVSNRNNMFVYRDREENVFYLRLYESSNSMNTRMSGNPNEYGSATVSRSPSIASLPIGHNKPNLAQSEQSIVSITSSDIQRPRVRSFGEKESRSFDTKGSKERINEDTLTLRVHGITSAGSDVQCELVQVLQNRLDDAVLDFLSVMLARNAMCPLTPEDVRFIQKPFQKPEHIIRLTIQKFTLQWLKTNSFIHYLKQNLLQFLNLPKYSDNRIEYHFKDYTETGDSNILTSDNIFIYNQSQTPSSGSRGIACIVLALIYNSLDVTSDNFEIQFENVFITKEYESCVSVNIIKDEESCPKSYLEFRLWKQGRINLENLCKKLKDAVSQATWDIVTEYYLLKKPLCAEEYRENVCSSRKKVEIATLNLDLEKEIEYKCVLHLNSDKGIREKVINLLPRKIDAHYFPSRKYSKKIMYTNLRASRVLTLDSETDNSLENSENGVLSIVYSKFLPSWLEFGYTISTPAVKKHRINLVNRHLPSVIVKELMPMLEDSPKAFRAVSTHCLSISSEDIYVPFMASNLISKYVIVPRNLKKTQSSSDENGTGITDKYTNSHNLKHSQKFIPGVVNDVFIPRQKFFWISVENDNIVIYTYNWAKDNIDKLINNCFNLTQWLSVRSCYLNSATSQKLGLFHNEPLTRKCFMLSTNSYYNLIGNLDSMSKFPRDHLHKKVHQSSFNLPIILEAFRDNFCNTKYSSHDIVVIFTIEMREMKSLEKKNRDEMKKLHSMYQSRTGTTSISQLNLLMQNSRILHFVHTPLLFLSRWRLKSASTRDHSLYPSQAIQIADKLSDKEKEFWHTDLCYIFFSEYRNYLHTLGFTPLQIDNPQGPLGTWTKDKSSYDSVFYIQRTILGGILIFTVSFEEPFFVTKLHAIECNRLQNITSRASVNGFTLSFLDECDKVKILMHLHSFTYDYHLRCTYNYVSGNPGNLREKYNIHQFLDDFLKYYNKAPNFARNIVHTETLTIENLVTEGKQLYDYLLSNVSQYGFKVLETDDTDSDYILAQVTTTRKVSYKDSQDREHTDDFDMTLVVYNLCFPYKPTDSVLHLKYYLILTSKRDNYPMYETEHKLGKFRTVSSAGASTALEQSINDIESSLHQNDSNEEIGDVNSAEGSLDDTSLGKMYEENPPRNRLANVTICQESVNYLGYYSSHEQIMQQLILDNAKATQKEIRDMVAKGMVHCRTNLLWNRLISPQDSTTLSFDEFIELKNLAKLKHLCHLHPNLGPLLNKPLAWYQGLAKLLLVKYADQHRTFFSPDENVFYYVILHPRYYGAFMLLSLDQQTSRGELYAVYREPHKQEDADPLGLGYEKSLRDGFVNCICFYLWSGMISS